MLNAKIREYILDQGVKFAVVADKANIAVGTFSAMMNGRRKITAEDYFAICAALNVSLDLFAPNAKKEDA